MAVFTFLGAERIIQIEDTIDHDFTAQDVYSRWKEWVLTGDNSKYEIAFRSVAGDPISPTQNIAPYIFLNTVDGWRIRCHDGDHSIRITGNLYSEDPDLSMFTPPLDGATVQITIDRSSAAIAIQSGSGLSPEQVQWLKEIWQVRGLDAANPLSVTTTTRRVPVNGSIINQTINESGGTVTVQRQP